MQGKSHSPSGVVSCAAVVTVGVEYGVDVVKVVEEAVAEDGVVEALVLEDVVEDGVVKVFVLEDVVEDGVVVVLALEDSVEAVVDVPGGAAWGVERTPGGGDKPYTARDSVHGSVGQSWPWTSWAQSR